MEKLIYLLGKPETGDPEELAARLHGEVVAGLKDAGASRLRTCIIDPMIEPAEGRRRGDLAIDVWCYLSLWVPSRTRHGQLKPLLSPVASFVHGYAVAESEQLFHEYRADGSRCEGMNEVVCFRKPEAMDRREWLDTWLGSHTGVAIDTQSTFGYIQQIVGDVLDPDSPRFDAIVEENFPEAAMGSDEVFFDAEGDPQRFKRHLQLMIESSMRFIDMDSINIMPMSEYNH